MKKLLPKLWFIILLCLSICNSLNAQQAPQGINYQATARNAAGNLLENQSIQVKMVLRKGTASGTVSYEETHAITTNAFGLFSLVIGQGNALANDFESITWSDGAHFLQVLLDPAGGNNFIDMGTTQLLSVPYALYAERSGDNGNVPSLLAGKGIDIANDSLINTGDTDASDDLTLTSLAEGDVSGNFSTLKIEQLQGTKLEIPSTINEGSVLKWDGTRWKPETVDVNFNLRAGDGIAITNDSLINTGDIDASDDLTKNSEAEGDMSGQFSALKVEKLQGTKLQIPSSIDEGSVLKWDGNQWKPDTDQSGASFWTQPEQKNLSYPGDVLIGGAANEADGAAEFLSIQGKSKTWHMGIENKEVFPSFFIGLTEEPDGTFQLFENGTGLLSMVHVKQGGTTGIILQNTRLKRGWRVGTLDDGKLIFGEGTFSDAGSSTTDTRLAITRNGKVGIGTFTIANPTHELHLIHASTAGGGATAGIKIENEGSSKNWWAFYTTNSSGELELYYKGAIRGEFDPSDGEYRQRSDARLKRAVAPMSPTLAKVLQLQPSTYFFKDQENPTRRSLGFIAQEVQSLFPELVGYAGEEQDIMTLNYSGFSVLAIKAIQEQQALIKQLEQRIEALEQKLKP